MLKKKFPETNLRFRLHAFSHRDILLLECIKIDVSSRVIENLVIRPHTRRIKDSMREYLAIGATKYFINIKINYNS